MSQNHSAGVSNDARAMMLYEANKKSIGVAYLLWFFLGLFGGHRFYSGKTGTAIVQLVLTLFGLLLSVVHIGWLVIFVVAIWALIDAFLIPGWIRNHNSLLAMQLGKN